jgi:hypothetical protein
MKITLGKLLEIEAPLAKLIKLSLPVTPGYWLAQDVKPIIEIITDTKKQIGEFITKNGAPSKDRPGSTSVTPDSPNWEKHVNEVNTLLAIEREVEIHQLTLEDLKGPAESPNHLIPADIVILEGTFIKKPEAPKPDTDKV